MNKMLALALLAVSFGAFAQANDHKPGSPESPRMACKSRDPAVDRHACMREMINAKADQKNLTTPTPEEVEANKLERCKALTNVDATRREVKRCIDRVKAGTVSGDVDKGGTITELREVVPAK